MAFSWPLTLIKRLVIGRKIKPSEEDGNMTNIEEAINGLHDFFEVVLNPNGTLKDGAVSTNSIQDRAVTITKLAFLSHFYAVATGTGDVISVAFVPPYAAAAPPVLPAGIVIYVKAIADNTGAVTLTLDGNGPLAVKKFTDAGVVDLVAHNIKADGVYEFVTDGTQWVLTNPTAPAASATGFIPIPKVEIYTGGPVTWADKDLSLTVPAGAKAVVLNFRGYWNSSTDGAVTAKVRSSGSGNIYDLGECGGVDGTTNRCQIQTPCATTRHIEIQVETTVIGAGLVTIDCVGYIL